MNEPSPAEQAEFWAWVDAFDFNRGDDDLPGDGILLAASAGSLNAMNDEVLVPQEEVAHG